MGTGIASQAPIFTGLTGQSTGPGSSARRPARSHSQPPRFRRSILRKGRPYSGVVAASRGPGLDGLADLRLDVEAGRVAAQP